jgi:DNA helicase-2/ATP-dependent DNA helicase PcrA
VSQDKLFLEIPVREIVERQLKGQRGRKTTDDYASKNQMRTQMIAKLLKKGMVPFDHIPEIASALMQNEGVRRVVCNRIQYLFIDEFQDVDTCQMRVFDALRKGRKTTIYAVGDPEQYILGFTYGRRLRRSPKFENIPICKCVAQRRRNDSNRRAYSEIVDFTNHFHTQISQTATKGSSQKAGVFFIADTDMDAIIAKYRGLTQVLEANGRAITWLYLAYENRTFESHVDRYGLTPVSNDSVKTGSLLSESLALISAVVGLTPKQIREKYDVHRVGFRKLGICLIKVVRQRRLTEDELVSFVQETLGLKRESESAKFDAQLHRLTARVCCEAPDPGSSHQYSSIHKAKGLEADAVLVVATKEKELNKWLTTNKDERRNDQKDTCRIGFVAFSRARQILCIACKERISDGLKEELRTLGVLAACSAADS